MQRWELTTVTFAAGLAMFIAAPAMAANEGSAPGAPAHELLTDDGLTLVTSSGITLYENSAEDGHPGKSLCSNVPKKDYDDQQGGEGRAPLIGADITKSCLQEWPPYLADARAQPGGDFGLVDQSEGGKQWTYQGHLLYLSAKDKKPGDRNAVVVGFGGGRFGGFHLATVPENFPAGLKLARWEEGLIIVDPKNEGRPVYTRGTVISKVSTGSGDGDLFKPILAPAMGKVSGDWSIVSAGAGRYQYAFRGQRLYSAPASMKDYEIAEAGGWSLVVFKKGPGVPSDIKKQMSLTGELYTDKAGHTLYTFNCSTPARDNVSCDGPGAPSGYFAALCGTASECAKRWHPYLASANAKPVGEWAVEDVVYPMFKENPGVLYPSDLPHVKAWTYRGKPVYTYYEDKEPGEFWGGAKWIGGSSFAPMIVAGHGGFFD